MQKQSLNHGWEFQLSAENRRSIEPQADATWQPVNLPHDWSIGLERSADAPSGVSNGFFQMGRGFYRTTLTVPEEWRGKQVMVEFEGVYMNAEVWLNENLVARHPYGYTSFMVDVTPYLKFGAENVLRVTVDNAAQTNSRWYSGSGIYRPVWLYVTEQIHIDHWGVSVTTPEITAKAATVRVKTEVVNQTGEVQSVSVHSAIYAPDNSLHTHMEARGAIAAGAKMAFSRDLIVQDPQLWSPAAPRLYRVETRVKIGDNTVDTQTTLFGIRTISFDARRGFLLNGQPLKLKGGCVHHDNGILGAASYSRAEERKVAIHKASGYNAIRTAHNPPSPAFLEACDRLGMLVMDEAFDCWKQGKNPYDYHTAFEDWWQRDLESMIRRDRNHPSIILWSIGNEVGERDGRSGGAAVALMLAEEVRRLDYTRPVTSAICGVWDKNHAWADTDAVFAALDVGGYNYQWKQYVPDHERYPERVMVGCESTAMEAFESWNSVLDLDYVIGDFVWTSLDYLGESGIGRVTFDPSTSKGLGNYPWHQANCGDLDLCGYKRPQSYYRDILWGTGNPLYIAVHTPLPAEKTPVLTYWGWPDVHPSWTWAGCEGQVLKVDVYSACEQVELLLNGQSLGRKPATKAERHMAAFEVPYTPGELKAVGYTNNNKSTELVLCTVDTPTGIRLTPELTRLKASDDLCYVQVEIVDENGRIHPAADRPVFFSVKGPGSLIALGSADPLSSEPYQGHSRTTFAGRCLVVVKTNGQPGNILLRVQADGLDGAEVRLTSE